MIDNHSRTPILGFAAFSGTGKTTLLTQLIPLLMTRGLRVGLIKYSHHDFEIDYPQKDSHRLRMAGASPVMLVSPYRQVIIEEFQPLREIELRRQIEAFPCQNIDLLLVEGFRDQAFPKIELYRPCLGKPLLYPNDLNIIAIASDQPLTTPARLPQLDLNQPEAIADFIIEFYQQNCRD